MNLLKKWRYALRPRTYEICIMRDRGFSYREIGELHGWSPQNAFTLIQRAWARIEKLEKEDSHA